MKTKLSYLAIHLVLYALLPSSSVCAWDLTISTGYMLPGGDVGSGRSSAFDTFVSGNTALKASLSRKYSTFSIGGYLQGGLVSGGCDGYRGMRSGCNGDGSQFSLGPEVKYEVEKWPSFLSWVSLGIGLSQLAISYRYSAISVENSRAASVREEISFTGFEVPIQTGFIYKFTESLGLGLSAQFAPGMFTSYEHCYSNCGTDSYSSSRDDAWYYWYGGGLAAMFEL